MINDHASLLVRSLVRSLVHYAHCDFSFHEICADVQHPLATKTLLTIERSRSKFKVKTGVLEIF